MHLDFALMMAAGLFFGNWLIVPIVAKNRSFKDGFWIGVVAGVLILLAASIGLFK